MFEGTHELVFTIAHRNDKTAYVHVSYVKASKNGNRRQDIFYLSRVMPETVFEDEEKGFLVAHHADHGRTAWDYYTAHVEEYEAVNREKFVDRLNELTARGYTFESIPR